MSGEANGTESEGPVRSRRFAGANPWLIGALAVSLALNAFVLGAVVGERWHDRSHDRWSHHHKHHFGWRHGPVRSIHQFAAILDSDARRKLRQAARPHKTRMKLLLADAAEARLKALETLSATDFDPDALEAAFTRSREAEAAAAKLMQEIIADAAARFTPEERAAVNQALARRRELWREHMERRREKLKKWRKHEGPEKPTRDDAPR